MTPNRRSCPGAGPAIRWLHLLGFSSFALAQPLFDLLERHASFLVVQKLEPAEIVGLALVLTFAPPTALWMVEWVATRANRRLGTALHYKWVALLTATACLPILKNAGVVAAAPLLWSAAAVGLLAAFGYARVAALRTFATAIGVLSLAFLGIFLTEPSIRGLLSPSQDGGLGVDASHSRTPVVMVIFDEFPISSILGATGEIDAARFPNFARLGAAATWFRNATSVDSFTLRVVPAILTGNYPGEINVPPVARRFPHSLFRILQDDYVLNVVESHTALHLSGEGRGEPTAERAVGLARDLYYVYLHVILPSAMTERLPSVNQTWSHFGKVPKIDRKGFLDYSGRPGRFQRFVDSIRAMDRPALHFLHIMIPHTPWQFLPSGSAYEPTRVEGGLAGFWPDEPWWGLASYQRHLLQVQYVDRLLGQLIDHLDVTGLWDSALVVVTADHGVSFWPSGALIDVGRTSHPEDILNVPLFVKRPGQATAGKSLRVVESVDVLPTILDVLGVDVPWEMDGCSAYDPECPERQEIVAFKQIEYLRPEYERFVVGRAVLESRDTLARKLEYFGSGEDESELYRFTRYRDLVGRRVADAAVATGSGGRVRIDPLAAAHRLTPAELAVPARISGTLEVAGPEPETPYVAVALDGIVRTVVPVRRDGQDALRDAGTVSQDYRGLRVSAMLPETALRSGSKPSLFLVDGPPAAPVLRPLRVIEPTS